MKSSKHLHALVQAIQLDPHVEELPAWSVRVRDITYMARLLSLIPMEGQTELAVKCPIPCNFH